VPKRVLDFDAMWGSDKLASCAAWAQVEYAWLYGLADASGCFEITNLRVIWGRVAAIRGNFTIERLEQVFTEFQDKGLLFVWGHEGKRYAHWTGSDVPGRLPPPSWRMRLERFAPPVPKQQLAQYMARFARGRAALAGVGFRGAEPQEGAGPQGNLKFEISDLRAEPGRDSGLRDAASRDRVLGDDPRCDAGLKKESRRDSATGEGQGPNFTERSSLKGRLEEGQGQDLGLDWNRDEERGLNRVGSSVGAGDLDRDADKRRESVLSAHASEKTFSSSSELNRSSNSNPAVQRLAQGYGERKSARELAAEKELRVGQGPVCGPGPVKAEVIERDRRRLAAWAGSKAR
jgi:hypothetical protein